MSHRLAVRRSALLIALKRQQQRLIDITAVVTQLPIEKLLLMLRGG